MPGTGFGATSNSRRSNSRGSNSRGSRGGRNALAAGQTGNTPQRARPQARSRRPQSQTARRNQGVRGEGPLFPAFQVSPLITTDTVYFAPSEVTTNVGKRFSTPLFFYNPNNHRIDHFDLWIHYDPELVEPVWVDSSEIEASLKGPMTREVWRDRGYIHLEARFGPALQRLNQPVAILNWRAAKTAANTSISIAPPPGEGIGVYEGSINCLEISRIGNRGLVDLTVRILDEGLDGELLRMVAAGEDPLEPRFREGRGVHLALVPAEEEVLPGEISTLEVFVINPDLIAFDEVRFRLRYNPMEVDILDADEGNYITRGINIYDGDFHDTMPFEAHEKNAVDPVHGIIDYVVGSGRGVRTYRSGAVARIVFRMKRKAGSAAFWFEGLNPLTGRYVSDVRARGRSLLGPTTGRAAEGLHHAAIRVAPL